MRAMKTMTKEGATKVNQKMIRSRECALNCSRSGVNPPRGLKWVLIWLHQHLNTLSCPLELTQESKMKKGQICQIPCVCYLG